MKTFLTVFLLLFFSVSTVLPQDKIKQAEKLLDKYFELEQINGNVLIAEKDKIILSKAYGIAEFDAGEKLSTGSSFVLASISKTMTAMGILKLADQGKISLDEDITDYFPQLPYKGVTVKHLVSNTSGIPEYRPLFVENWDRSKNAVNDDVINMLAAQRPPLLFKPGSEFRYSNTGFVLLASVIKKVTDRNYEDYMKEEIFIPAGMNSTFFFNHDIQYDINNFAFPYMRVSVVNKVLVRPETIEALNYMNYLDRIVGDVSTASTTENIYKFDKALLNGDIINSGLMKEAFTPFTFNSSAGILPEEGYGYGWFINRNKKGQKIVSHEGGMAGTSTFNYINLDEQRFIIVLSNTNATRAPLIAENLARIFDGEPVKEPKPYIAVEIAGYIEKNGAEELAEHIRGIGKDKFEIAENDINILGYNYLQNGDTGTAIEIFKVNVELFPGSWNVYDSLGEGYMNKGEKELAIKSYKKSLELNPDNENGKRFMEQLMSSD